MTSPQPSEPTRKQLRDARRTAHEAERKRKAAGGDKKGKKGGDR